MRTFKNILTIRVPEQLVVQIPLEVQGLDRDSACKQFRKIADTTYVCIASPIEVFTTQVNTTNPGIR